MATRREIVLSDQDIRRFWNKVDKSLGPSKCWLWMGARLRPGYGIFMTKGNQTLRAHRVSMTLSIGKQIPIDLDVCHKCDNPPCVNPHPNHLFLGTMKQNLQDAFSKGRCAVQRHPEIVRGERNGSAKLNEKQVRVIKQKKHSISEAAKKFGVSLTTVKQIRNGTLWSHVRK